MKQALAVVLVCWNAIACGSAEPARQGPVPQAVPAGAPDAAGQAMAAELKALVAGAQLEGTVAAWCRADFQPGRRGGYAVAVETGAGGRYLALEDERTTALAVFTARPDLSCYTRGDAEQLNRSIGQSETIHGQITPRWNTTVVCGFTDDTTAECWQYSPVDQAFVKVGGWTT